jgi:hypothetical protein
VRELAARAEAEGLHLREVARADPRVAELLGEEELEGVFDLRSVLAGIEASFARLSPPD